MSVIASAPAAFAAVPSVVASSASQYATGLGVPTKAVVDTFGNVFVVDISSGNVLEIPVGGGTPKVIASPGSNNPGIAIDAANNLYVTETYSAAVYVIPYNNGNYSLNTSSDVNLMGNFGALDGYYMFVSDVTVDNAGHAYISQGGCCQSGSPIFKVNTDGTSPSLLTALPGGVAMSMAVDNNNHLYYADGTNVYVINPTATVPTPTVLTKGFNSPGGVAVDAAGNLYVSDGGNDAIYVIPYENGAVNPADMFLLEKGLTGYSDYAAGIDGAGNLYIANGYNNNGLFKLVRGGAPFGPTAVGSSATATVGFAFNAAVTPASIAVQQGTGTATEFSNAATGTCTVGTAYTAGQSCTVQLSVTPASTGTRTGAVVLYDASNKAISTGFLSSTGTGPALTVDPGTQTALTAKSAFNSPSAVAMDGAGNIYAADAGTNVVQVISAGGATATIGSGLKAPGGVAVDGAGNVYISDTGNNRVVEVPNENGTLNTIDQVVVLGSLNKPLGLAVGGAGSLYIADSGNARVLRLQTYEGLALATSSTVGSGYTLPVAVTTDNNGNVYVADETANKVSVVNLASGAQTTALAGLGAPTSIALDASGSLYVVNSGTGTVLRVPNVSGALNATTQLALGSNLTTPSGVAVNGAGNVVIADAGASAVYSLQRTAGAIGFGSVNEGLSSATQTLTLTSAGTAPANLGATPYTASGSTANFTVSSASSNGCTASEALTVGSTCAYSGVFSPTTTGVLSETLTFSSDAVNASNLTALLSGTGTNLSTTTTTIAQVSPTGNPAYGQAVTVSATVVAGKAGFTPTGTVTFSVDGIAFKTSPTLSTTSPYTAMLTLPALYLTAGTHAINATYNGDSNNAASSTTTALIVVVTKEASITTLSVTPTISQQPGSTFVFNISVAAATAGGPTGTVNLVLAGTTTVLASGTLSAGSAAISYVPAATAQYQAIYAGDVNFNGSTSASAGVSVRPPGYDVSISNSTPTVVAGQSVTTTITITSVSGYAGNVAVGGLNLTSGAITSPCTGLPVYVTCNFSPGEVALTANGTATIVLTVNTDVPPAIPFPYPSGLVGGLGLVALALAARKHRAALGARLMMLAMLGGITLGISGCGTGAGTTFETPKGTSMITLTLSGSPLAGSTSIPSPTNPNITQTMTLQLTVQ